MAGLPLVSLHAGWVAEGCFRDPALNPSTDTQGQPMHFVNEWNGPHNRQRGWSRCFLHGLF